MSSAHKRRLQTFRGFDVALGQFPPMGKQGEQLHVRSVPIVLKKSVWDDDQNFLGPLMRFARGDMRDHIVSHKTTTDLRSGATELCSGQGVEKSTFARFSQRLDFRVLQQYLPIADIGQRRRIALLDN